MATTTRPDLFKLIVPAIQALAHCYNEPLQQAIEQSELTTTSWNMLLQVQGAEPGALTLDMLARKRPYLERARLAAQLTTATEHGLLAERPAEAYQLTERGRTALTNTFDAVHAALQPYQPLPEAALERAAELLRRLVEATVAAPEPADKQDLLSSRRTDPGPQSSAAARIDQYLTDLLAFRDDAHRAAWQPITSDGPAWEIFTCIWRGEANTLAALQQQLARREHSPGSFERALHDLAARGWISGDGTTYQPSQAGRALREQAEELTDRYFYTAWNVLGETEIDELHELLSRLRDSAPPAASG